MNSTQKKFSIAYSTRNDYGPELCLPNEFSLLLLPNLVLLSGSSHHWQEAVLVVKEVWLPAQNLAKPSVRQCGGKEGLDRIWKTFCI
jgi:hypothetical protein